MFNLPKPSLSLGLVLASTLGFLTASCGAASSQSGSSETALRGSVVTRATGFSARPSWAEPDQAWSKSGETLVVVGHARVKADQRVEMAYRASDSYARAELLRFLTVRVMAVLFEQQSDEATQEIRERISTQATGLVNDWFIGERYWEKRQDSGEEYLHVFSRLEVSQAKVQQILISSTADSPDLTVSSKELQARLSERWQRIAEVTELAELERDLLPGVSIPTWAQGGDSQSEEEYSFVCHASAEEKGAAEALARARCNEKLCRLFGVQITARTTVTEDLDGMSAENQVTESCAEVRAVGRETQNRTAECTDDGCMYWLRQTYSKSAFRSERKRLAKPTVVRQEVVIQEGDTRYRDPAACEKALWQYSNIVGLEASMYYDRLMALNLAFEECQGIDTRDAGLLTSLNRILTLNLQHFTYTEGKGPHVRAEYAAVPPGWKMLIQTERFFTTRIDMVRVVVKDAVFPMSLIDATMGRGRRIVSDEEFEKLIAKLIARYPFRDAALSPWHTKNVHSIIMGMHENPLRYSPTYRKFLLKRLKRKDINCDTPKIFNAGQMAIYLGESDGEIDEEELQALVTAYKRAPSREMDNCLASLFPSHKSMPRKLKAERVKYLEDMLVRGELVKILPSAPPWRPVRRRSK